MRFLKLMAVLVCLLYAHLSLAYDPHPVPAEEKLLEQIAKCEQSIPELTVKWEKAADEKEKKTAQAHLNYAQSELKNAKVLLPIARALKKTVTLKHQNTPLETVVAEFNAATGLNIAIDRFVDRNRPITLNLKETTAREALEQVAEQAEAVVCETSLMVKVLPPNAWTTFIQDKLQRKVTFEFVDTPFADAITFVRDLANVSLVVDNEILAGNPPTITLRVTDMSLQLALDWICKLAGMQTTLMEEAIYIMPAGKRLPDWFSKFTDQLANATSEAEKDIAKKFSRKVTFEFNETPLSDAIGFLNQLSRANIILDPRAVAAGIDRTAITLRVMDMSMSRALAWICLLSGARCEIRNQALFITEHKVPQLVREDPKRAEARAAVEAQLIKQPAKLHVRLASGAEVTAEGAALLQSTSLTRDALDAFFDQARDGLLIYSLSRDLEGIDPEAIKPLLARISPTSKVELVEGLPLLLISGDNPAELRRAATAIRKLRESAEAKANPPVQTQPSVKAHPAPQPEAAPKAVGPGGPAHGKAKDEF